LQPRAASRLLASHFPVNEYLTAFRGGANPAKPAPGPTWLLVYRHRHQVQRLLLAEGEYVLLSLLAEGKPLAMALQDARFAALGENVHGDIMHWLARWLCEGCLREPI
jgi:hypothetical protein